MNHVRKVLGRLLENHLYVKPEKCEFHTYNTQFLGFIISPGQDRMDPKKLQAVLDWPVPTSVKEVQRFIGFANFYRKFVWNFSSVADPLTALTKSSSTKFAWNSEAKTAFLELKCCFTSAPVLSIPDPELPFIVEVDASDVGIGAVFSQRGKNDSITIKTICLYRFIRLRFDKTTDIRNMQIFDKSILSN